MKPVQLEPKHLMIVQDILKQLNVRAFVFGSRTKKTARPLSDLDLCLRENYNKSTVRQLQDLFAESDLPFKVDVIVWSEISESFQKNIEKDFVEI